MEACGRSRRRTRSANRHSFTPASKAHKELLTKGRLTEAKALEQIIVNKSWTGERLQHSNITNDAAALQCARCGHPAETRHHRYYTCCANDMIDDTIIHKTRHFAEEAEQNPQHEVLWYRAILPRPLFGKSAGWTPQADCGPTETGDFEETLDRARTAGSDGSADKSTDSSTRRVGVGAAVFDENNKRAVFMFSRVPGSQTVPRAEIWALLLILKNEASKGLYSLCRCPVCGKWASC